MAKYHIHLEEIG